MERRISFTRLILTDLYHTSNKSTKAGSTYFRWFLRVRAHQFGPTFVVSLVESTRVDDCRKLKRIVLSQRLLPIRLSDNFLTASNPILFLSN